MCDSRSTEELVHKLAHLEIGTYDEDQGDQILHRYIASHSINAIVAIFDQELAKRVEEARIDAKEELLRDLSEVGEIHHSVLDYRLEAIEEERATLNNQTKETWHADERSILIKSIKNPVVISEVGPTCPYGFEKCTKCDKEVI